MQPSAEQLKSWQQQAASITATIGFDGFIDSIVKLVKQKEAPGHPAACFNTIADWGNYILSKKSGNFSTELRQNSIKAGGNMPNMATALATLGIATNCIGAMGYPIIDPLFSKMPAPCRLYSYAPPGTCQAVEFEDGKMMLANTEAINKADWNLLKERIPITVLIQLFNEATLTGLLNWGELPATTGFWQGLLQDILPHCTPAKDKIFFADLSDCSSRTKEETLAALDLLAAFSAYGKVILSLNYNESIFIHNQLFEPVSSYDSSTVFAKKLFNRLRIDSLLLHHHNKAVVCRKDEIAEKQAAFIETPKLLTGAGDNFNAGYCFAQLMACSLEDSLLLAHTCASYYIKNAESAGWSQLTASLKTD